MTFHSFNLLHLPQMTLQTNHNLFEQKNWLKKKKAKSDICQFDQLVILDKLILTCPI
jgi:hypothetical protein